MCSPGTELGNVYALNANTGKVVWKRALGEGSEGSNIAEGAGIVGSPAVVRGLVYVGATTPKVSVLSALDRRTGKVVWKRVVDKDRGRRPRLEPGAVQGHGLPGLQGRRVERPLVARLRDPRRVAQGARQDPGQDPQHPAEGLRGRLPRRLDHQHAGSRPEEDAGLRRHRQPGQREAASDHQLAAQDRRRSQARRRSARSWPPIAAPRTAIRSRRTSTRPPARATCSGRSAASRARSSTSTSLRRRTCGPTPRGARCSAACRSRGCTPRSTPTPWKRRGRPRSGVPCFGCNLSSTAVDKNGIYVAVTGGNLYSLNRDTGAIQWATPLTGGMRYNGVAVANGIVYSLNDAHRRAAGVRRLQRRAAALAFVRAGHRAAHERHGELERGLGRAQHGVRDVAGGRHQHAVRAQAGRDRRPGRRRRRRRRRGAARRGAASGRRRRSGSERGAPSRPAPAPRATGT